ncbi:hypothetical protein [Photobacterium swingsii]|uniref:hypothetical protein n=1 Tax=Photobacterium swingsii TaxID=680026 RepID=UPI0030B7F6AC
MKGIKKIVGTAHTAAQPLEQDPHAAKLKSTLLNDIKRSAYVYRVDCGAVTPAKLKSLLQLRLYLIPSALVSRWLLHRVMPIFYCLRGL